MCYMEAISLAERLSKDLIIFVFIVIAIIGSRY